MRPHPHRRAPRGDHRAVGQPLTRTHLHAPVDAQPIAVDTDSTAPAAALAHTAWQATTDAEHLAQRRDTHRFVTACPLTANREDAAAARGPMKGPSPPGPSMSIEACLALDQCRRRSVDQCTPHLATPTREGKTS
jgi:hypothetical protein